MNIIQDLLTNETWNFWRKDWSERIIVEWPKSVYRKDFFSDVQRLVGEDFIYERSLSGQTQYKATKKGLKKFE